MTSETKKILLTGATGYIGGSILHALVNSSEPSIQANPITCLLRGPDRAALLSSTYGDRVKPVLYRDLDDLDATVEVAAQHDIVINTTLGFHPPSALALVRGLAKRKALTGRDVWMIHTSGTSNVADRPITNPGGPVREFDDVSDDIYAYEKEKEAQVPYLQRTAELAVVDTGLELGVKTTVIMSPVIFGPGTGLFNKLNIKTAHIRAALQRGQVVVAGEGAGVWNRVHIDDLVDLYTLVLLDILDKEGKSVPTGKKGIMFSANGRYTWLEFAQNVADACFEEGLISDKTVARVSLEEMGRFLAPHVGFFSGQELSEEELRLVEVGFSSNALTVASAGRNLGWAPSKGDEAWKKGFRDCVKLEVESKKQK
ncbi:hypothetical protein ACRALDRAFT_1065852 [Sodiomyces alcalophilus JCM 7366]|uniref:uncharacterized protein n=1 Tax=Sodiomyces alcalophilus JCM 7366 TaxID=591952 RepID=UPI0039B5EA64